MSNQLIIELPDLFSITKFKLFSNPNFSDEMLKESLEWIKKFSGGKAHLLKGNIEIYCSYAFAHIDAESLKLLIDSSNYFILTDEFAENDEEKPEIVLGTIVKILNDLNYETDSLIELATKE